MLSATFRSVGGFALAIPLLVALISGGCGKKNDASAAKGPAAGNAGAQGPGATPTTPEVPPAPKAQGPLSSQQGTRPALLELTPQGRLLITILSKDRKGPEIQEFAELECTVFSEGRTEAGKLIARPTENEKDGKTARYSGYFTELNTGKAAVVTITFPSGEPRMARFNVPDGYRSY